MICGFLKAYPNFTLDYVLREMSYANLIMYSTVLPSYDFDGKRDKYETGHNRVVNASDPSNNELVGKTLFG